MSIFKSMTCKLATTAMLLVLLLASCTKTERGDRRADLLTNVPDDATITLAFSPAAILKSAGVEIKSDGLTLPNTLERILSSETKIYDVVKLIASAKGINYNSAVIAGGTTDGCALFALDNADKFCSWAKDNGMTVETEGQYTVCSVDEASPTVVIDGLTAWFLGAAFKDRALSIVKKYKAAASENKLADWKIDALTKSDINILFDMQSYAEEMSQIMKMSGYGLFSGILPDSNTYSTANISFDGPTVRATGEVYDRDGKVTDMFTEGSYYPIAKCMIDLVKDSQMAFAFSIPESYKAIINMMIGPEVADLGPKLNSIIESLHNAAYGFSINDDAVLVTFKPTDMSMTLAIEVDREEFAKGADVLSMADTASGNNQYLDAIKACTANGSAQVDPLPQMPDFKLYFTGNDGFYIVSTDKATADANYNLSDRSDLTAYFKLDVPKTHQVLSLASCPFGVEALMTATNRKSEGYITLTDTDTPFLEAIINFASRF